jgi:hypothetical protein
MGDRLLSPHRCTEGCDPVESEGTGLSAATAPQIWVPPEPDLPEAEQFIRDFESWLGPCAQWFVRSLWMQASIRAFADSRKMIEQADRYTRGRLEEACRRALVYNLKSLEDIETILAEGLDRLPLRRGVGLTGQLPLPLEEVGS